MHRDRTRSIGGGVRSEIRIAGADGRSDGEDEGDAKIEGIMEGSAQGCRGPIVDQFLDHIAARANADDGIRDVARRTSP